MPILKKNIYLRSFYPKTEFDGFDGPAYPKPLFALYTFADTYFDRSLHFWVCRYFYDPNCNQGFIQETIGAAITFTFVWVSQGAGWEVGCWACLNFAGLQIESFINKRTGDTFELGVARVLKFVLLGINYMLIINANLVGIVGYDKAIKLSSFIYTSGKRPLTELNNVLKAFRPEGI